MTVSWIWARKDRRFGRLYYHQSAGFDARAPGSASWMYREKKTAYRFATKEAARKRMRRFAREWKYPRRQFVIIQLTRKAPLSPSALPEKP